MSCLAGVLAAADGFVLPDEPPPLVNEPGMVVLRSGRTISGRISQNATGFVVVQTHGSVVVPYDLVEFTARDLKDAVRLYHERTPNPTAGFHIGLAEWCLGHQMLDEARAELRSALALEPHRLDARNMLRRLEALLEPPAPAAEPPRAQRPGEGFEIPEVTSLGGLDPGQAGTFTERVQPILMNKCGNASCHGPSAGNDFRLTRVRLAAGAHRIHSERNLAATLRYVDRRQPDISPLLLIPQGNHGRAGRTIFHGPPGSEQLETLREWVRSIALHAAADRQKTHGKATALPDVAGTASEMIPAAALPADARRPTQTAPADAFDPEAFNRAAVERPSPVAVDPALNGFSRPSRPGGVVPKHR